MSSIDISESEAAAVLPRMGWWATLLMSVAALATSWASYQASVWSGEQASRGAKATSARTNSTRASMRAWQLRSIDVGVFTTWMSAYGRGDTALATFISERFRPEFAPAFRVWIASRPRHSPTAAASPFTLAEYHLADDDEAERLERAADIESAASEHANGASDGYVLNAVLMATVMFFASAAQQGQLGRVRLLMMIIATATFAVGLVRLAMAPLG